MVRKLIAAALLLFMSQQVFSQNTFYGTYNTPGAILSKQTSDGNFVCAGHFINLFVMKINPQGQILWEYQTPFSAGPGFTEIEELVDGSLIFIIGTPPPASTYLLKLDSGGVFQWCYRYTDLWNNQHDAIEPMPDTGFIMIGSGTVLGAQVTRCRKDGTISWQKTYTNVTSGNQFYFTQCELTDNNRNIFLSGTSISSANETDVFVAKMDTSGTMLWHKEYSIPGTKNYATALCPTYDGFAIAIQYAIPSPSTNWFTCGMARFDTSGTLLWASKYQYSNSLSLHVIAQQSDSSFVLGGSIPNPQDTIRPRAVLIGVDPNGQHLWTHSFSDSVYGNNGAQGVMSLTILAQGDMFVTCGGPRIPIGRFTSQGYGMCNPVWYTPQTSYINTPSPSLQYDNVGVDTWVVDTPNVSLSPITHQQYISCTNIITTNSNTENRSAEWNLNIELSSGNWIVKGPADQTANVSIYDCLGKLVFQSAIKNDDLIYPNEFPSGSYLYSIQTQTGETLYGKLLSQ